MDERRSERRELQPRWRRWETKDGRHEEHIRSPLRVWLLYLRELHRSSASFRRWW